MDFDAGNGDIADICQCLLELLSPTPTTRDVLIRTCDVPASLVNVALLEMELSGEINVEPDRRVSVGGEGGSGARQTGVSVFATGNWWK